MSRRIRVGLADSGVNDRHRHIGGVAGGVGIRVVGGDIVREDDWGDLLGHGTAVAATIRGHAPDAELYSIRIFRRRLEAHVEALLAAIDWAAEHELDLLNLSLGCTDLARRRDFELAIGRATAVGLTVVSAAEASGEPSLPGILDGVLAVRADPELEDAEIRHDGARLVASYWARQLGELPKERNFKGVSFAVAHVTGLAAATLAQGEPLSSLLSG